MTQLQQYSSLTTAFQGVGILLMACLLLPMSRVVPGPFLRYWTYGWCALTIAIFSVLFSMHSPEWRIPLLTLYCFGEYVFAFLLWAGCRAASTGEQLEWRDGFFVILLAVVALLLAVTYGTLNLLFPIHSLLFAGGFLLALLATRPFRIRDHTPTTGLWLMRISLAALALLFAHYAIVSSYYAFRPREELPQYLSFSSLYDVLLETGLAFGMVMLATDRMRETLLETNQQLAEATRELDRAACTDPLTGLFNRRGFDALLRGESAEPISGVLAVIDMNDLKQLNDQYGHPAGDEALQLIARTLRVHFRVTDPLYRTGGDEFVVLMVGCNEVDLQNRLLRLDDGLTALRITGIRKPIDLSVAWGTANFNSVSEIAAAYSKADHAMYAQKSRRKDRLSASEPAKSPG